MEIRRSYDRLISTLGFLILVRWHLYFETVPCILTSVGSDLLKEIEYLWKIDVSFALKTALSYWDGSFVSTNVVYRCLYILVEMVPPPMQKNTMYTKLCCAIVHPRFMQGELCTNRSYKVFITKVALALHSTLCRPYYSSVNSTVWGKHVE